MSEPPHWKTPPRGHGDRSVDIIMAVVATLVLAVILYNNFPHTAEQVLHQLRAVLHKGW